MTSQSASRLESGDSGTARLLWVEPMDGPDSEIAWTATHIGSGTAYNKGGAGVLARQSACGAP